MTTFRGFVLLILTLFSIRSYCSDPKSLEALLLENNDELQSSGAFIASDDYFYYLGTKALKEDPLEAEFEFLINFNDQVSKVFTSMCSEHNLSLRSSYRYKLPFSKQLILDNEGTTFVAILSLDKLKREKSKACSHVFSATEARRKRIKISELH
jgi:hypothetical protein